MEGKRRNLCVKQRTKLPVGMTFPHSCCRNPKAEDWQVDVHAMLTSGTPGAAAVLMWVYPESFILEMEATETPHSDI